jgi:hypothetical protein
LGGSDQEEVSWLQGSRVHETDLEDEPILGVRGGAVSET